MKNITERIPVESFCDKKKSEKISRNSNTYVRLGKTRYCRTIITNKRSELHIFIFKHCIKPAYSTFLAGESCVPSDMLLILLENALKHLNIFNFKQGTEYINMLVHWINDKKFLPARFDSFYLITLLIILISD